MLKMTRYVAAIAIMVSSCGNDDEGGANLTARVTDATNSECPVGGKVVSLGPDDNGNGELDDSEVTESFTTCNGEDGADGADGIDGVDGAPGADSGPTLGIIEASVGCGAGLEGTALRFRYMIVIFTDGSVWAKGSISSNALQVTDSSFYAPTQVGALTAPVYPSFDVYGSTNAGWWKISLNRTTFYITIEYHDTDLVSGVDYWSLPLSSNGCVVNTY